MQKILKFLTLLLVSMLAACGGGGGSPGEASGTRPLAVDIPVGYGSESNPVPIKANQGRLFKITGGRTKGGADGTEKRSYLVNVEETGVVGLSWAKTGDDEAEDLFVVSWVDGPKQTKVTVRDADDKQVSFYVKTEPPSPVDLYTTAPDTLTIGVGAAAARTFDIGGGSAPYVVTGANSNVALVEMLGTKQWKVTGVAIGETAVTIRDAAGRVKGLILIVGAPELRISPDKLTIPVGIEGIAKISGGQPPYRIAGGIPAAITAVVNGDEVRIMGSLASKLDVTVADATGQTVKVEVEINTTTTGIRFSPGALTISENDAQSIDFTIFGATDKVCIYTSDPTYLVPETAGCTLNRTVRLVTGSRGNRCVAANKNITVTVVDSTRAVGTAVVTIADNGTGCSGGAGGSGFSVTPTAIAVTAKGVTSSATSNQVVIVGGSGSYIATSSNPNAAVAVVSGNVVTVTGGIVAGSATITVIDKDDPNQSATVAVTVGPGI